MYTCALLLSHWTFEATSSFLSFFFFFLHFEWQNCFQWGHSHRKNTGMWSWRVAFRNARIHLYTRLCWSENALSTFLKTTRNCRGSVRSVGMWYPRELAALVLSLWQNLGSASIFVWSVSFCGWCTTVTPMVQTVNQFSIPTAGMTCVHHWCPLSFTWQVLLSRS